MQDKLNNKKEKKYLNKKDLLSNFIFGALGALVVFICVGAVLVNTNALDFLFKNKVSGKSEDAKIIEKVTVEQSMLIDTVKKTNPAVVSIAVTKEVPIIEKYYEDTPDGFDDFFRFSPFGFQIPKYRENGTEKKEIGGGSGFLVSGDGMIVTNKHVVDEEDVEYTVFTNDDQEYRAIVVARDPSNDIAILKIDGENFPYLEFADSDKLQVGQTAIAIGNALGEFRNTVSVGVVSGLSRSIVARDGFSRGEKLDGVIQTDAGINRGNSGGPLLDIDGKVIGVNVAMAVAENIGFALPSKLIKSVVDSVKENGKIIRPFLGVRYIPITEELKTKNRLSVDYGALIIRGETISDLAVTPGSSADKAGIVENDIILEIDGVKIDEDNPLSKIISQKNVGDKIKVKILHKGEEKEIDVVLEEMDE